jgi:hypothetical protein
MVAPWRGVSWILGSSWRTRSHWHEGNEQHRAVVLLDGQVMAQAIWETEHRS